MNEEVATTKPMKTVRYEVEIIDIDGIPYYADKRGNIFRHETIGQPNPEIVARWVVDSTGKRVLQEIIMEPKPHFVSGEVI
jgi:hypothetical protein